MYPPQLSDAHWKYNPLQPDAYLLHLGATQAQTGARAAEDIYSSQHHLILEKDTALTAAVAANMMLLCLDKPLEESIQLQWQLDAEKLLADLTGVMQRDDIFLAINERHNYLLMLSPLCSLVEEFPVLQQKLTIMSLAMPDIYERTLYCVWLSLCIAKEMRLSQEDTAQVVFAALLHDLGMLHVDATILRQRGAISPEEWQHIQHHVAISFQLLKATKNLPSAIAYAVYEHHEQSDGTGYPLGKLENELGLAGQIINVADAIIAIHFNYENHQRHSWRQVIPLIQMNAQAYLTRANEMLLAIVRRSDLPVKNVVQGDEAPEFIEALLQKNTELKNWFAELRESLVSIGYTHGDRRLHALQNVMLHLATAAAGSGIFNEQHTELLAREQMEPEQLAQQVEKMHLMQQEIIFHLQRLSRMTQLYLDSGECKNHEIRSALAQGLKRTQKYLP